MNSECHIDQLYICQKFIIILHNLICSKPQKSDGPFIIYIVECLILAVILQFLFISWCL
jgi:hypothetical protein